MQFGNKAFRELFPEYVKTSGALTLTAGVVAKPSDCFTVSNLYTTSTLIEFTRLKQDKVADVLAGIDKLIIPSATRPYYYEENGNIYTLGITTGTVIARYIVSPADISPITAAAGNGNYRSSGGSWTVATRTLSATMHASFTTTDVNKPIMFQASTGEVYSGIIESLDSTTPTTSVILRGDALPAGNVTSVTIVLVTDVQTSTDLKLNIYFHGEVIERSVRYGLEDMKNGIA